MWSDTIEEIQRIQQECKKYGYPLWYRGQRDANWPLLSSIHRYVNRIDEKVLTAAKVTSEDDKIKLMRSQYKTLFYKFKTRAIQMLPEHERTDWGLVFAMQHLGLPTRLLDWTESFPCALYFAQLKRKPADDAVIFMFRPEQHNQTVMGKAGVVWLGGDANKKTSVDTHSYHPGIVGSNDDIEMLAIEPELTNTRMIAQRSKFTLCGASFQPLEIKYPKYIKKFVLRAEEFNEVQAFLNLTGQNHVALFPDLEGLKEHLIAGLEEEISLSEKLASSTNP
jgi:hypothetical protein